MGTKELREKHKKYFPIAKRVQMQVITERKEQGRPDRKIISTPRRRSGGTNFYSQTFIQGREQKKD